jgi:hypothetical protein
LRLLVLGTIKLVRLISGRPAGSMERPIAEAVAPRKTFGERAKRVLDGGIALLTFVIATLATGVRKSFTLLGTAAVALGRVGRRAWRGSTRWWQEAAQPSLNEARDASLALMTESLETSGRPDVLERLTPVLTSNGSMAARKRDDAAEMQLV